MELDRNNHGQDRGVKAVRFVEVPDPHQGLCEALRAAYRPPLSELPADMQSMLRHLG